MKQERSPSTWDEQQHKHREGGRVISFNIIWYYLMPKTLCQCALQHIAPRFRTSSWLFSHRQNISSHFCNNLVTETFFVKLSTCYSWKSQDVALLQPLRFNAFRSHMSAVTAARLEESSRVFHRPKVATVDIEDKTPVDPKSDCRSSYVDSRWFYMLQFMLLLNILNDSKTERKTNEGLSGLSGLRQHGIWQRVSGSLKPFLVSLALWRTT